MRTLTIPGLPVEPSVLCLGTALFGSGVPRDDAWRLLDAFVESGGNFLDTARVYAEWLPNGTGASERTLGAWLRKCGNRNAMVVGTKGCTLASGTLRLPELSPEQIGHELNESLQRLQTDVIDLYWLHRDNPAVPVGEILDALAPYVHTGTVHAIGASNWTTPRLREAAAYARTHGRPRFVASQISWSLAAEWHGPPGDPTTVTMDGATHAFHVQTGMPLVAYSSQAHGFFAGRGQRLRKEYGNREPPMSEPAACFYTPANLRRLERAEQLARNYGVNANSIALAYLTSQPFAAAAIFGSRTVDQVRGSGAAGSLRLTPKDIAFLEEGSP